jgi:two-component system, OmpR family, sensor histidine kinase KdpD
VQSHLASSVQRKVVLLRDGWDSKLEGARTADAGIPEGVRREIAAMRLGEMSRGETVTDPATGSSWFVRAIAPETPEFGLIAVDLGAVTTPETEAIARRIESVLTDATATLRHLDIGRAIREAEMRAETDRLREAVIGSVSHDLRSPLTSILCSASILRDAPALAADARLAGLVDAIRDEAERHNNDIQNLLDASRISSRGVRPEPEWCDPTDIVHAAIERFRKRYPNRPLELSLNRDLPLLRVDSTLVEQALLQVIDNAAKYSSPNSTIEIAAQARDNTVRLVVSDQGIGLTHADKAGMWNQFFRGDRHAATSTGSGLGLWVAHAFVTTNGGTIVAASDGEGCGTTVSIEFPFASRQAERIMQLDGALDE